MSHSSLVLEYLESVVYGKRKGTVATVVRVALSFLSVVYQCVLWAYLLPFRIHMRAQHLIPRPVVSVGNLSVGGTGKTPVVQYLCRGLLSRGWSPAVLSYGYGGSLAGGLGVAADRDAILMTPAVAGDEPVMLAMSLPGVPVVVCKHRDKSGRIAVDDLGADVLVLDDGFQVWKLHRDLDIVLVNADIPFDNGRTLPAGKLREPISALKRAHCVVATGVTPGYDLAELRTMVRRANASCPVYGACYRPSGLVSLVDGSTRSLESLRGTAVFAFSAIGNPDSFRRTLDESGVSVLALASFPDHHSYSDSDVEAINERAVSLGAEMIVTTEKDAVKLREMRFAVPAVALGIDVLLDDETGFWKFVADRLGSRSV